MPEKERPLSDEQKITIEDKINRAMDRDMPEAYVIRSDGSIEGGWLPYDLTKSPEDMMDEDGPGTQEDMAIVHLAKIDGDNPDSYKLKAMYRIDFDSVQAEARDINEAAIDTLDDVKGRRVRALRMSAAYRNLQQRLHDDQVVR